jgi:DNA-binding transcriptional LysR family regulator
MVAHMLLTGEDVTEPPTFLSGANLRAGRLVPPLPNWAIADIDVTAFYPSRRHFSSKVHAIIYFLAD